MKSVANLISDYYNSHQKTLSENYPGLGLERFVQEYLSFSGQKEWEFTSQLGPVFFEKIEKGIPLEYINQSSFFFRSNFFINENVLIPRSETEILVEDSLSYTKSNYHENFSIAEIGVGSFNIGLSLLCDFNKKLHFIGGDISCEALEVAKINSFQKKYKIHPDSVIDLVLSDRLERIHGEFDLIISNPPYIKENADLSGVHEQTLEHEPHQALFLKDQEYDLWFNQLFTQVHKALKLGGAFFMEGHEDHLEMLKIMALQYFNRAEVKKDYTKRDRFLYCYK